MASIGPTAFYTGETWARHGLSHPAFRRPEGRLLHLAAAPVLLGSRILGGPTLDGMLLARHLVIDALLEEAIADGRVEQVIEIACGMSPRGWRLTERHPSLTYVEGDLPEMAARKRAALEHIPRRGRQGSHRVAELDALAATGPRSLRAVARTLDPERGLAVITEGLLSYLPRAGATGLWRRTAATLGRFPSGLYLADLHIDGDTFSPAARLAELGLSLFVRGRVAVHFATADDATAALERAGFARPRVLRAAEHPAAPDDPAAALVRVVAAAPA